MNPMLMRYIRRTLRQQARHPRGILAGALAAVWIALPRVAAAQQQGTPPPPVAPAAPTAPSTATDHIVIPEGTAIHVTLQEDLKSGAAKTDEAVPFTVANDTTTPNGLVIRAGTPAVGHVTQSVRHGLIGKPGKIAFTCDYLTLSDSTHIPLRPTPNAKYGRDNRAASVATAIVLTPLTVLISGSDVTAKKGTEYTVYLDSDTAVSAAALKSTPAAPAIGTKSALQLNDGTTVVGTLTHFDGTTYIVTTENGTRTLKASDVKSISPVK